ncbi:MAG: hypothetical protein OK441_05110 [Thaumarchaeota archaeon]|nr:hypothetical protein [Nitrososphaerota archaeon]
MPSSTKASMEEQPVRIADLFSKCSELAAQEEKETVRIVSTMLPMLAWLDEPVVLQPESLGNRFREFRRVTLETGAMVMMTDLEGRVSSKQLTKLRTEECLAILRASFPELQRLIGNKRRAADIKPALSLKVVLGGPHFIVDKRSYRLIVSNSGGDCVGVSVSTALSGCRTQPSRPCDVSHGKQAEVDLGVFKELDGVGRLEVQIDCKDADGRGLCGEESVSLDGASWQEAVLRRKS